MLYTKLGNTSLGNFLRYHRATVIGMLALAMWALEPLLVSEINRLPIFEVLAIIFLSSFAVTAIRITRNKSWKCLLTQPAYVWLVGVVGICASDFAYIYGSQFAPIAHVELIDYLWPSFAILFASFLPSEKLNSRYLIGAFLGFAGIFFMFKTEVFAHEFNIKYMIGYTVALLGAALWGGYSAFSRHHRHIPTEMVGIYCGVGGIICLLAHLQFETFVMPTMQEGGLAILTGITGAGAAYQLWDYGVKYGNIFILSILVYVARLLGMALLVACGKEPLTVGLVVACLFGTIGVLISTADLGLFDPKRILYRLWYSRKVKQYPEPISET